MSEYGPNTPLEKPTPIEIETNNALTQRLRHELKLSEEKITEFYESYRLVQIVIIQRLTKGLNSDEETSAIEKFSGHEAFSFQALLVDEDASFINGIIHFKTTPKEKKDAFVNKLLEKIRPFHKSPDKKLTVKTTKTKRPQ
ncbi:MAG: hypothetical protein A2493_00600 [Candidatus Magasanikbacteria bacterium RIFOXYC12_FULL_33_11]|uniref:Uncharacterized protein n=1 Tax=Candidatus Magasanikbacteria bacterium RIFOXYC12_FULL_33_11 TaxID=1798701 RepID=A0A1F6NM90_9BACT|nr:MAG: hypothetical protein A2493_00600 [Candidatus Magasanikbacteria bacterium RIFOXYC12_FULL_33_11]